MDERLKEKDIISEEIAAEKLGFMDKLRQTWTRLAFSSTIGKWAVKFVLTLIVFVSLLLSVNYGLAAKGSLINAALELAAKHTEKIPLLLLGVELAVSVTWLFRPMLGTLLCAILLYASFAGIAPLVLLLAFFLLLMFQLEDQPVIAMMIALPALTFVTDIQIGLLLAVLAAFVSTRKNNGTVRSVGFVYWALLELCRGGFGTVVNSSGQQIIPASNSSADVWLSLKKSYRLLSSVEFTDGAWLQFFALLAIFFVVGLAFARLLRLRYTQRKLPIDVLDAILFTVLAALLCLTPLATARFAKLSEFRYRCLSIVLQVLAAYILTRPIAGKSPYRADILKSNFKHYIFISYAHFDTSRIRPYLSILDKNKYEYWFDDGINTGDEWNDVIAGNIANCTCFFAFVSKTSVLSGYCMKEINYALHLKKPMALIILDNMPLPPTLEMILASHQAVYRYKLDSDQACMQEVFKLEDLDKCSDQK